MIVVRRYAYEETIRQSELTWCLLKFAVVSEVVPAGKCCFVVTAEACDIFGSRHDSLRQTSAIDCDLFVQRQHIVLLQCQGLRDIK